MTTLTLTREEQVVAGLRVELVGVVGGHEYSKRMETDVLSSGAHGGERGHRPLRSVTSGW
jgi:hypothetical protein